MLHDDYVIIYDTINLNDVPLNSVLHIQSVVPHSLWNKIN